MVGAQIAEGRGKRTSRRVLATEPTLRVEASVEEMATMLGVQGLSIITYVSTVKQDGSLYGEGEGVFAAPTGEMVTWKGIGVGRFSLDGSIRYTGSLSLNTSSPKLSSLNGISVVFEWDIDAQGNTHSKLFEFAAEGQSATIGIGR